MIKTVIEDVKSKNKLKAEKMEFIESLEFQYTFDESHVGIGITTKHTYQLWGFYIEFLIASFAQNLQAFVHIELKSGTCPSEIVEYLKNDKKFSVRKHLSKNFEILLKLGTTSPSLIPSLLKNKEKLEKSLGSNLSTLLFSLV